MLSAITSLHMQELSCLERRRIKPVSVNKLIYFYGDIFTSQIMIFLSCCTSVSPVLNYSQYVPDLSSALNEGGIHRKTENKTSYTKA